MKYSLTPEERDKLLNIGTPEKKPSLIGIPYKTKYYSIKHAIVSKVAWLAFWVIIIAVIGYWMGGH